MRFKERDAILANPDLSVISADPKSNITVRVASRAPDSAPPREFPSRESGIFPLVGLVGEE
jgi:hypothetical protein